MDNWREGGKLTHHSIQLYSRNTDLILPLEPMSIHDRFLIQRVQVKVLILNDVFQTLLVINDTTNLIPSDTSFISEELAHIVSYLHSLRVFDDLKAMTT